MHFSRAEPSIMPMPISIQSWTVADLDRIPADGNRYEVLVGVLLVTPAPTPRHQVIATRLAQVLGRHLDGGRLGQVVAPGAIRSGPSTQLQPDVLVFPPLPEVPRRWEGMPAAWLAIEVLSRSSHLYDRNIKRDAYLQLGVREVWLVDPIRHRILTTGMAGQDHEVTDHLVWTPPGPAPPLEVILVELFEGMAPGWEEEDR